MVMYVMCVMLHCTGKEVMLCTLCCTTQGRKLCYVRYVALHREGRYVMYTMLHCTGKDVMLCTLCCTAQGRKLSWSDNNRAHLFDKTTDSECYVWVVLTPFIVNWFTNICLKIPCKTCCGPQNQYYYERIHWSIREKIIKKKCDLPAPLCLLLIRHSKQYKQCE